MWELNITERQVPERLVTVLDLTGTVTVTGGARFLTKEILRFISEGGKRFVLNFGGLDGQKPVDSEGIGQLVTIYRAIKKARGRMVFINIPETFKHTLEVTKLTSVFKVYKDEDRAVRSFRLPRAKRSL